jgi:hypothetical protein
MALVDRQLGEYGEQEARSRLERALLGTGKQLAGHADLGLDLIVQYPAPSIEEEPLLFGVQVKTGNSFAEESKSHWKIKNLDRKRFSQWQKVSYPVLFLWVRPTNPAECYWGFIRKNTNINQFLISKKSQLSPTARYDFALEYSRDCNPPSYTDTFSLLRPPLSKGLRPFAKEYYMSQLHGRHFVHPLLGSVAITRNAWNHLTRKKRPAYFITQSLQLLPIVSCAIENPTSFVGLRRIKHIIRGGWVTDIRLLAFKSSNIPVRSRPPIDVICVLREQIIYPVNWINNVSLHKETSRTLSLESIYEKTK